MGTDTEKKEQIDKKAKKVIETSDVLSKLREKRESLRSSLEDVEAAIRATEEL